MKQLLTLLILTFSFASFANAPAQNTGHGTEKAAAHVGEKKGGANMDLFPPPQADHSKTSRPGKPELIEPKFHTKISTETVVLKWNVIPSANAYHLQVATDPNFKWLVNEQMMMKETSFEVKGLQKGTHYFWRVAALKTDNNASYMKSWYASSEFETP